MTKVQTTHSILHRYDIFLQIYIKLCFVWIIYLGEWGVKWIQFKIVRKCLTNQTLFDDFKFVYRFIFNPGMRKSLIWCYFYEYNMYFVPNYFQEKLSFRAIKKNGVQFVTCHDNAKYFSLFCFINGTEQSDCWSTKNLSCLAKFSKFYPTCTSG